MADTATETPQEEEAANEVEPEEVGPDQPTSSEELAVYQEANEDLDVEGFDGVTDSVPGAVTDLTPEPSKKELKARENDIPHGDSGFVQLAATDTVEELGLMPGTRVRVVSVETEIDPELTTDPYHPVFTVVEGGDVVVEPRDAGGGYYTVTAADLEAIAPGTTKG